jgi:hypothetical protein
MKHPTPPTRLRRVGTAIINNAAVPVYQHTNGGRYAEVLDLLSDAPNLVSIPAAKAFKAGGYPVQPDFALSMIRAWEESAPSFMSLTEPEQRVAAQALLTRLFERIDAFPTPHAFLEN